MNSNELKALQAPLKEKYKDQLGSAIITLQARGKIGENVSCNIETGKALVKAGLHPATGGIECLPAREIFCCRRWLHVQALRSALLRLR